MLPSGKSITNDSSTIIPLGRPHLSRYYSGADPLYAMQCVSIPCGTWDITGPTIIGPRTVPAENYSLVTSGQSLASELASNRRSISDYSHSTIEFDREPPHTPQLRLDATPITTIGPTPAINTTAIVNTTACDPQVRFRDLPREQQGAYSLLPSNDPIWEWLEPQFTRRPGAARNYLAEYNTLTRYLHRAERGSSNGDDDSAELHDSQINNQEPTYTPFAKRTLTRADEHTLRLVEGRICSVCNEHMLIHVDTGCTIAPNQMCHECMVQFVITQTKLSHHAYCPCGAELTGLDLILMPGQIAELAERQTSRANLDPELLGMMASIGAQRCGRCGNVVEKSGGCNHIICICKYEFCYSCGIEWQGQDYVRNCNCPMFD